MPEAFLGDGLIFEDLLPLVWTPGPPASDLHLARMNADNHQLLGAEASLNEVRVHEALKDESPALLHELQRLEFKLNILLRLTADLATRNHALPPAQPVRLTARGMEWMGPEAPASGMTGVLDLYLNAALPQPLRLPATSVGERFHDGVHAAQLQFTGLSDPVVDLIEKFIFRHHRRLVAGARQAQSAGIP